MMLNESLAKEIKVLFTISQKFLVLQFIGGIPSLRFRALLLLNMKS